MVMLFSEIKALDYSVEFGSASRPVRTRSSGFNVGAIVIDSLTIADKRSVTPAIATPAPPVSRSEIGQQFGDRK